MDYTFQEQSLKVVSYKKNSVAHFDGETCSKLEIILLKQKEPSPVLVQQKRTPKGTSIIQQNTTEPSPCVLWMITAYYPSGNEWLDDLRTR